MQILFVSASVGAGHNQAAAAIMGSLQARHPQISSEFVDALEYCPWWFRFSYSGIYQLGFAHFPRIYGWCYRILSRPRGPGRTLGERMRLRLEWLAMRRLRAAVVEMQPQVVVATHFLPAAILGGLIKTGQADLKLWTVVTDCQAHRFWYTENVERYFLPNERSVEDTRTWQLTDEQVTVSGIPVHPKWTQPMDTHTILADWNLPADRPIVLLNAGAYFTTGPTEKIVQGLLAETSAHVVVLAGANKKLLARLAAMPAAKERLTAVPFTDRVHELAHVASLAITKAGGMITSECVAQAVPMVLTKPVPGQEQANAASLTGEGAAVVGVGVDEVIQQVLALVDSPEALHALRVNARRIYLPAAETIADAIADALAE